MSTTTWCPDPRPRGLRRRQARRTIETERQRRPIPLVELEALWSDTRYRLRDRVYRAVAYDTAARADELLGFNVENIDLADRSAVIIGKGGSASLARFKAKSRHRSLERYANPGPTAIRDMTNRHDPTGDAEAYGGRPGGRRHGLFASRRWLT